MYQTNNITSMNTIYKRKKDTYLSKQPSGSDTIRITFQRFESATIKRIRLYNVPIFGRGTKTCLSFESWVIWRRSFFIVEDPNPNIDAKFGSQLAKCSFRIRNKLIFNSVHGIFCKITSESHSFWYIQLFGAACRMYHAMLLRRNGQRKSGRRPCV